jgi:hypothetical protein
MSCTTTTDLQEELADLEEQLVLIKAAYKAAITGDYESYRKSFPGGSSQRIDRRKPSELREEMAYIRAEISRINRILGGCANPTINLRRRC